jgi:hypothetical protein
VQIPHELVDGDVCRRAEACLQYQRQFENGTGRDEAERERFQGADQAISCRLA